MHAPAFPQPGGSTAAPLNVQYRLSKLKSLGILRGDWLDFGCATGGYTEALVKWGATRATGIDPDPERIAEAQRTGGEQTTFLSVSGNNLPFESDSFDGVFLNEVLEHVEDENTVLCEIRRVLRSTGTLVVISPNRWFPFEGHGMRVLGRDFGFPIPLLPWVPSRLAARVMTARNYWPYELCRIVETAGFTINTVDYVLPVLEKYPWLPTRLINWYQRSLPSLDQTPLKKFGVSTMIVANRADMITPLQPSKDRPWYERDTLFTPLAEVTVKLPTDGQQWIAELSRADRIAVQKVLKRVGEARFLEHWTLIREEFAQGFWI